MGSIKQKKFTWKDVVIKLNSKVMEILPNGNVVEKSKGLKKLFK